MDRYLVRAVGPQPETPGPLTQHHRDQLLDALFYTLDAAGRGRIMAELPDAYRRYCWDRNRNNVDLVVGIALDPGDADHAAAGTPT